MSKKPFVAFAVVGLLLICGCGGPGSSSSPNPSPSQADRIREQEKENARLKAERDALQKKLYEEQKKAEDKKKEEDKERERDATLKCVLWGFAALAIVGIAVLWWFIGRNAKSKHTQPSSAHKELECPRCHTPITSDMTRCPNPDCKIRLS